MTDLHTHILPAMDDGSKSVDESLAMLAAERAQGVDLVVLTPHFYRSEESAQEFLARRAQALEKLRPHLSDDGPELMLGAEVAWFPTIAQYNSLEQLRLGESGYFLLELPWDPWPSRLQDQLYELSCISGLTPILAHLERYLSIQNKSQVKEVMSMGLPMQMNAGFLLKNLTRSKGASMLSRGEWHLGSDTHNMVHRPPNMGLAIEWLQKKLDPSDLNALTGWSPTGEGGV